MAQQQQLQRQQRADVHLLWHWATLPCPSASACLPDALARLGELAAQHGRLATATFIGTSATPLWDPAALQPLREQGVEVEEVRGEEHASSEQLLMRLLRLTLQLQAAAATGTSGSSPRTFRPSVIVLSNLQALSSSLALMRQSGLFGSIVLLHGEQRGRGGSELAASASAAVNLELFLRGESPTPMTTGHTSTTDGSSASSSAAPSPPPPNALMASPSSSPSSSSASSSTHSAAAFARLQLRTSPTAEEQFLQQQQQMGLPPAAMTSAQNASLLGVHPALSATNGVLTVSPHSNQPLLPTPSPHNPTVSASSANTPSMRFFSHSNVPSPLHSGSSAAAASAAGGGGGGLAGTPSKSSFGFPGGLGSGRTTNKMAASAPSSPTGYGSHSGTHQQHQQQRSFFPSSVLSPSQQQQQQHAQSASVSHSSSPSHSFFRSGGGGGGGGHHLPHVSSSRVRACVQAYTRIVAYCESEKLIPRESVLKKRLVDSRQDMSAAASAGVGSDFEEFLYVVTQVAGAGVMEGEAPQRIVWPRGPDGGPRRFPCADFFTPQARLTPSQNAALMEFLYRVQPEVERGRFGFATYLARHGPPFIQRMPHGVLVELVQLLLNMKVLLFRKGKVSVASKSEAIEAQNLGLFFTAENFLTPAASRAVSPAFGSSQQQQPHQQQQQQLAPEQSIWDDSSPPAPNVSGPSLSHGVSSAAAPLSSDEANIWSSPATSSLQQQAHHIDRTMLSQRRGSVGGSPLYLAPFMPSSSLGGGGGMAGTGMSSSRHGSSFSMPGSRAHSPSRSPPGLNIHAPRFESAMASLQPPSMQQQQLSSAAPDFEPKGLPPARRKSISTLQPLPVHAPPGNRSSSGVVAANVGFDVPMHAESSSSFAKSHWLKDDLSSSASLGVGNAGGGGASGAASASGSAFASRRSSMSDLDGSNSVSWRASPAQAQLQASLNPPRFEQSTGFAGESQDACDPAAVLSAKLAQLNRGTLETLASMSDQFDDLSRFTAAVQYRACFHFEKSGAAHTPEWVSVLTFCVGTFKFQMSSQTHSKKDAAKADVAMRALMAIEENQLSKTPHIDLLHPEQGSTPPQANIPVHDSVVDLARLLNFLQQAPVVYYLTRAPSSSLNNNSGPGSGRSAGSGGSGGRLDGRRASTGNLHQRHSSGGSSVQQQQQGPVLWNATARIQVKSVNVLTGEAQPAVSASTPFSHTVQGAASKQEAKEMIASSLLAQIERARVVNAALFTVLSAANSTRLIASLPAAARITDLPDAPQQQQTEQQHYQQRQQQQQFQSDSIWSAPLHSGSFGTGSHGGHPPVRLPSMDMARIAAAESSAASAVGNNQVSSSSSSSASLFSMHTPVAGRPFSGISNIGISTPHAGDATPLPAGSPASAAAAQQQQQQRSPHSAVARLADDDAALSMSLATMLRSVSEIEAEITSQGAAESALFETPRHAAQ